MVRVVISRNIIEIFLLIFVLTCINVFDKIILDSQIVFKYIRERYLMLFNCYTIEKGAYDMEAQVQGLSKVLPFEKDAHLEQSPILVKLIKPKNKTQEKFLLTERKKKKILKKLREISIPIDNYINDWLKKGESYIYMVHDMKTGKTRYSELYPSSVIYDFVLKEDERKRWIINSYNRKNKRHVTDQIIVNGMPVFRFYVFNVDYVRPGRKKQGFYETFRIWLQDGKFWMETRDNVSEYHMKYQSENFYKYIPTNKVNLYDIYPDLFFKSNFFCPQDRCEGKYISDTVLWSKRKLTHIDNITGEEVLRRHVTKNFKREIYMSFPNFYNAITKNPSRGINKNTPNEIKKHLEDNPVCSTEEERKKLEYISMKAAVSTSYYRSHYKVYAITLNDNLCLYRYYNFDVEIARIYFTPTKQYKFFFNFNNLTWNSTKNENFFYSGKTTYNYLRPNNTILNMINFSSLEETCISSMTQYILNFPVIEQLAKINHGNIMDSFITLSQNYGMKGFIKYNEKYKKFREAKSLNDWLTFGSKNLKYLDKEVTFKQLQSLNEHFKTMKKRYFKNDTLLTIKAFVICHYDYYLLKTIRSYYRGDPDGFYNFWKVLTKREKASQEFSVYQDYCRMVPYANQFARHTFSYKIKPKDIRIYHRRVTTDYNDYLRERRELENAEFEKKFKNVVKQKNYKQFLFEDENFKLIPPINSEDLVIEGRTLSHCVGSYRNKMANGNSFIYFIRKKDEIETPYYTMEIVPTLIKEKTKKDPAVYSYDINQIFGYGDKTIDNDELRNFIEKFKSANEIIKYYGYLRFGGADYWG